MDPLSFFTAAAAAIPVGKIAEAAWTGIVGNTAHTEFWKAVPRIQTWIRGEGKPANHHLQRAFRSAYLAATKDLLEAVKLAEEKDLVHSWRDQALQWFETQKDFLADEHYQPPAPPGSWEPAAIVIPSANAAKAEIAKIRAFLIYQLRAEWNQERLNDPPAAILSALQEGWQDPSTAKHIDWFDRISLYFAAEIKTDPYVQAIFQADAISKVLLELRELAARIPANTPPKPPAFFAPSASDYFVGREDILEELDRRLREPGAVVPLVGMPGLGKSTVAAVFAHRFATDFSDVYWVNCTDQTIESVVSELSKQAKISLEGSADTQRGDLCRDLASRHCLLVLDDVQKNEFRDLIPQGRSAVLLTARVSGLAFLTKYKQPEFDLFSEEDCLNIFKSYLDSETVESQASKYRELITKLGRLPIAIAVAAGLLKKKDPRYFLHSLLENQYVHRLTDGELNIAQLLKQARQAATPDAQTLLAAMAVCAPSGFRLGLAIKVSGLEETIAFDALADLRSRFLVEVMSVDATSYILHSLVRAEVEQAPALADRHSRAVADKFVSWETNWEECVKDLPDWRLALRTAEANESHKKTTEVFNRLAFSGFALCHRSGYLPDAMFAIQAAQNKFKSAKDFDGLQGTYGNQALIFRAWGEMETALSLLKEQEAICIGFKDVAGLQGSYGNQAIIFRDLGKLDDSMAVLKKQEAICKASGNDAGLQACYGNQAITLQECGKLEASMAIFKKQQAICQKLEDDVGLQGSYGNQAFILRARGKLNEAMTLLKMQEEICKRMGISAGLRNSYGNQAVILFDWGMLDEAMSLHKKEEALCLSVDDPVGLLNSYGNQALVLRKWGQLEGALILLKTQEDMCRKFTLPESLRKCLINQAMIYEQTGDSASAASLRADAAQIETKLMRCRDAVN